MKTPHQVRIRAALGMAVACLAVTAFPGRAAPPAGSSEGVVIVAHRDWPSAAVTRADIENVFLGKKTQWGSTRLVFVTLKGGPAHEGFLRDCVGKTAAQFKNYWKQMVFTGKGSAPRAFETENELVEFVAATEGAVGYVGADTKVNLDRVRKLALE